MRLLIACALLPFCAGDQAECDADNDHMSALQTRASVVQTSKKLQMLQRAAGEGGSSALEAVLAPKGKKHRCTETEAAAMLDCFKVTGKDADDNVWSHDLLTVVTGGEDWDKALSEIDVDQITCPQLKDDMECLHNNPCYEDRKVKDLPIRVPIGDNDIRLSRLCKNYKDQDLGIEDTPTTVGQVCAEKPIDMCLVVNENVATVKQAYEKCAISCKPIWLTKEEVVDETTEVKDVVKDETTGVKECPDGTSKVVTYEGCKAVAAKQKLRFKRIDYSRRPSGCYKWGSKKMYWNKAKGGKEKKGREAICIGTTRL